MFFCKLTPCNNLLMLFKCRKKKKKTKERKMDGNEFDFQNPPPGFEPSKLECHDMSSVLPPRFSTLGHPCFCNFKNLTKQFFFVSYMTENEFAISNLIVLRQSCNTDQGKFACLTSQIVLMSLYEHFERLSTPSTFCGPSLRRFTTHGG